MNSLRRWGASLTLVLPTLVGLLQGCLWAGLWGSWFVGATLLFGDSLATRSGIVGGMLSGFGLGAWLSSSLLCSRAKFSRSVSLLTGYVIAASASGWLLSGWNWIAESLMRFAPESMFWEATVLWIATFFLFLIPFAVAVASLFLYGRFVADTENDAAEKDPVNNIASLISRTELFGTALGLLFVFPELSRLFGWTAMTLAGATVGGILVVLQILFPACRADRGESLKVSWTAYLGIAAAAVLWVGLERAVAQLVPMTTEILVAAIGATLFGMACGGIVSRQKFQGFLGRFSWLQENETLVWLVLSVGVIVLFPLGIRYSIWVNLTFSSPWLMYAARLLLVAIALIPVGALVGATCSRPYKSALEKSRPLYFMEAGIACFALAWVVASWVLPSVGVVSLVGLAVALVVLSVSVSWIPGENQRPPIFAMSASVACLVLTLVAYQSYEPTDATLWISASRTFEAREAGIGNPLVPYLTDQHLVAKCRGRNGNLTLWNSREAGLQLWKNGVPVSTFSADTAIHPDYSGELLLGVLPLVLHPSANRVLVLGVGGGSPLVAALDAPVQRVDCVEPEIEGIDLVQQVMREGNGSDWNDPRLRLLNVNPSAWLAGSREEYDVVISNSPPVAFPGGAACFTREYYRRAARLMPQGGLFCQRLQCVDFGFEPFAQVVATLRDVFEDVLVIETAASDFLVFGSNDPQGIVRKEVIDRIQAPQVSRTMSRLGWDGLLATTIPCSNKDALQKIVPVGTSTITGFDGRVAFAWPREISRVGNKSVELHSQFSSTAGKLLDLFPEQAESRLVLRRLAEIQSQNDIIVKFPDQYWAYRKNAKEEVSKNPKTLISQIDFEVNKGKLDPEDRRRMAYFSLLGRAAKTLEPEKIRQLEQFLTPFDPLLSPFIPMEIAELYARAGHPDPVAELKHRLYRIYFSGPGDRSVVNVIDALDLINQHPEAIPEESRRWHSQNSLLQVLRQRWEVRMTGKPGLPRIMYRDAQLTLAATEKTLASMRGNCKAAGMTPEQNSRRTIAIQRLLVQPLQQYGRSLSPYLTPSEMANMGSLQKYEPVPAEDEEQQAEVPGEVQAN